MRIVLDTNVVVSGMLQPFGPSGSIVRLVALGTKVTLCYDPRILGEYREVLLRDRFRIEPPRVDALLDQIAARGTAVVAEPLPVRLPDPDDEMFLEVALAGSAQCLVTGNRRHYPRSCRCGVSVVSPREFVDAYRGQV